MPVLSYTLRETFETAPLAPNVVFCFLLIVLERLMAMEFVCSCKERWENALFVAAYFIIPAFLALVLMIGLHKLAEPKISTCQKMINCIISPIVWWNLLLFDGRYVVCGMTDWSGRFVTVDKAAPLKWCEPNNSTLNEERLKESQEWYFHSQVRTPPPHFFIQMSCEIISLTS